MGNGTTIATETARYAGVEFFAETYRGKVCGTVLALYRGKQNGLCRAAIGVPRGDANALPVCTWVSPKYLAKCIAIDEVTARQIHPMFFVAVDAYEASAEFRARHAALKHMSPLQVILDDYSTSATSPV